MTMWNLLCAKKGGEEEVLGTSSDLNELLNSPKFGYIAGGEILRRSSSEKRSETYEAMSGDKYYLKQI